MSQNSTPIQALTVTASAAIAANVFVTAAGATAGLGAAALGVSQYAASASGELIAVTRMGTEQVKAGAAIAKGAAVQSDASGRAITATTGQVLGFALEAATAANEIIEIALVDQPQSTQLANVLASTTVTRYSADGAIDISGIALVDGGTGISGLTLAAPTTGVRCEVRLDTLSSGSVVLTTASGVTFDGTNNTATFDAAGEALTLGYKSATEWEVVLNTGSVAFSAV